MGGGNSSSELWPPTPASRTGWIWACGALLQSQVWSHHHSGDTLTGPLPLNPGWRWITAVLSHECSHTVLLGHPLLGTCPTLLIHSKEAALRKMCHSFCLNYTLKNLSVYLCNLCNKVKESWKKWCFNGRKPTGFWRYSSSTASDLIFFFFSSGKSESFLRVKKNSW